MKALELNFKENRRYIQGPDIYNAVYKIYKNEFNEYPDFSKLSSRRMATKQLKISKIKIRDKPVYSIFEGKSKYNEVKYYLYETDENITTIMEYNEDEIINNSNINITSQEATIKKYDRYSIPEISVALLKKLCNDIISTKVKWIFVELQLNKVLSLHTDGNLKISLEKFIGTKIVIANIYLHNKFIGTLKFSSK